jgi:iron complex outermembrane receptor protein
MQHLPIVTSLGTLRGAIGAQFVSRDMLGLSLEEDANSLLEPTETDSIAAFIFEELDVTTQLTLQAAFRIEHTDIGGFERLNDALTVAQKRDFTPMGVSLGGLYRLPGAHVVSLVGQYVERAPDAGELFSSGVHEATGTFEIGDLDLELERASTIEAGLRKATGAFRYDATAFYTQFDGFIFKGLTGRECGETISSCGVAGQDELDEVIFDQRNATFYGVELSAQFDVAPI